MALRLNNKNRKAAGRVLTAFARLRDVDPFFAEQLVHELSCLYHHPGGGLIAYYDDDDRDAAREMLSGLRSKR